MLGPLGPGLGFIPGLPVEDRLPALPLILLHVYLGFHFLKLVVHVFILLTCAMSGGTGC